MTPEDIEAAKRLEEWIAKPLGDPPQVKIKTRVTLRKFDGDDTTGEPVETIVLKEDGFPEEGG